jgi:hypothetical protein
MIDQSSDRRFSTGVPVMAMRRSAGMDRTLCVVRAALFLICCASSRTSRRQGTVASSSWSRAARP